MNNSLDTVKFTDGHLTLPVKKDQFENFIKSLLGQPQRLNRFFNVRYHLKINDIGHLSSLINQRIALQNPAQLVDFTVKYDFSDTSSVTFKNFDTAAAYNELKPVIPTAVHLSWVFLLQYPDRDTPERQEVCVRFLRVRNTKKIIGNIILPEFENESGVLLEITHTNRTWAIDIESIVANYVTSIALYEKSWKIFLRKQSGKIALTASSFFFILCLFTAYYAAQRLAINLENELIKTLGATSDFNSKTEAYLRFLAQNGHSSTWTLFNLKMAIFLGASIIISFWLFVTILLEPKKPSSHILITSKSIQLLDEEEKSVGKSFRRHLINTTASLAVGLTGNYIFCWLTY